MHVSEIVSDMVEPLADHVVGGREAVSVEDLLAQVEQLNRSQTDWTKNTWWEDRIEDHFITCEVEPFLRFTIESQEDFPTGWLPTLDTSLRVNGKNQIEFKFYEKPEASKKTVQMKTALEENTKMKILANDLMRRFFNTMEDLPKEDKWCIMNDYSQKLLDSGYSFDQTRKIIINGVRGHESRKIRYQKQGRPLRRTGKASKGARVTKKLREKTSWFRQKSQEDCYPGGKKTTGTTTGKTKKTSEVPRKTCLFVEYTSKGKLAKKLRDTIQKLETEWWC